MSPGFVMVFKTIIDLLKPSAKLTYRSGSETTLAVGFLVGVALAVNLSRDAFEEVRGFLWQRYIERDLHYRGLQAAVADTDVFAGEIAVLRLLVREKKIEQFHWLRED